jgi:hypothetical protein
MKNICNRENCAVLPVAQAGVDRLRLLVLVHGAARGHLVPGLGRLQEVHQLVVHVHLLQAACTTGSW